MTSFTKRSGAFFTLRHHAREDDGCARTTGTVCSGGEPAGEAVLCLVRGVRDIAPPRMLWYQRDQPWGRGGIASRRRQLSPRRTGAEREPRVVGGAATLCGLGCAQAAGAGRSGADRSTIHRVRLRRQLVRDGDGQAQAVERLERVAPNEWWQMDFKSPNGGRLRSGRCRCLTIPAATCWCCQRCGVRKPNGCRSNWKAR